MSIVANSETRAFILCAGSAIRWGNFLGIPKQLITFNTESLLSRTIRLLRAKGIFEIYIVTNDKRLIQPYTRIISPLKYERLCDTLLSIKNDLSDRSIILLGDVFFSERAILNISKYQGQIAVFGRPWASKLNNCRHGELFGVNLNSTGIVQILSAAQNVATKKNVRGNLWDIYHALSNLPLNSGIVEHKIFHVIDDLTNDFDWPDDYIKSFKIYENATSSSLFEKLNFIFLSLCKLPSHLMNRKPVPIPSINTCDNEI